MGSCGRGLDLSSGWGARVETGGREQRDKWTPVCTGPSPTPSPSLSSSVRGKPTVHSVYFPDGVKSLLFWFQGFSSGGLGPSNGRPGLSRGEIVRVIMDVCRMGGRGREHFVTPLVLYPVHWNLGCRSRDGTTHLSTGPLRRLSLPQDSHGDPLVTGGDGSYRVRTEETQRGFGVSRFGSGPLNPNLTEIIKHLHLKCFAKC